MSVSADSEPMEQTEPDSLLDHSLVRHHTWSVAPGVLELWAAFGAHYRDRGVLKEVLLRGPLVGQAAAVAVTAGYQPYKDVDGSPAVPDRGEDRGGILHIVPPIEVQETSWVVGMMASLAPWQGPSFMGLRAFVDGNPEDRYVIAAYEHPTEIFVIPRLGDRNAINRRDLKRFKERLHLDRYCTDHLVALGTAPYSSIAEGNDPPDFVCQSEEGTRSVECVQFAVERRRRMHGLFGTVRSALLQAARGSRERFANLHGCVIYMWFADAESPDGLPPRAGDTEAVNEIVETLARYDADPRRLWVANGAGLPDHPDLAPARTSQGCTLYAVPMALACPNTSFFVATGFELGFGVQTTHRAEESWTEILRIIATKDREGTDDLLITVSGPNDDGFAFPSEELVATIALEGRVNPPATRYLKRVRLHFWNTGRIVEVVPRVAEVAAPTFDGTVLSHLPVAAANVE